MSSNSISSHCPLFPLSSNQCCWLTSATSIIFPMIKLWDHRDSNTGVPVKTSMLPLCYGAPSFCSVSSISPNGPLGHKFQVSANSSAKFTLSEVTTASPSSNRLSPSTRTPAGGRSAGQCWASAAGLAWPPWLGRSTLAEATMGTHFSDPSRSSILWITSKIFYSVVYSQSQASEPSYKELN